MMKHSAAITYKFIMELILAILALLLIYYIPLDLFPPILYLFGISLGGFILFLLLLLRFPKKGKWLFLICVFPLVLYLGSFSSMPLLQFGIFGIFIYWRGVSLFNNKDSGGPNTVFLFLFLLTGISLTLFSGTSNYPHQNTIIILFFIEIMLVLMGLFVSKWNTINENQGKFALYYGGFLLGAALLGVIITFGLRLVKLVLTGIGILVAYGLAYLLKLGYIIADYIGKLFGLETHRPLTETIEGDPRRLHYRIIEQLHSNPQWIGIALLTVILIAVYYIYKKRRKALLYTGNNASMLQISEEVSLNKGGLFFKKRAKPPKDPVRSEVFQFERFAHKLKLGRKPFESITEWWARVGINESGNLSKIYGSVRYGEVPSTEEDVLKVKAEIIRIKQQIKEKP